MTEEWTISEEEWAERREQAEDAGLEASQLEPHRKRWGLFAYGDAAPAIGGGVSLFQWFKTKGDLLNFVKRHLTFQAPGRSHIDPGRVARDTEKLIEAMASEPSVEALEATRLKLNEILTTFSQVEWWGTFEDLLQGNHPYAKEVRASFREDDGADNRAIDRPIGKSEIRDVKDAIATYGI